MAPLAEEWEARGYGIQFSEGAPRLTHIIWADNIWIVAEPITQSRKMMKMLTGALLARRLAWEDGSLELLASSACVDKNTPFKWKSAGVDLECIKVDKTNMLEILMDGVGSTNASVDHRMSQATRMSCSM